MPKKRQPSRKSVLFIRFVEIIRQSRGVHVHVSLAAKSKDARTRRSARFSTFIDFRFCERGLLLVDEERDKAAKARRRRLKSTSISRAPTPLLAFTFSRRYDSRRVLPSLSARESTRARDFPEVSFT